MLKHLNFSPNQVRKIALAMLYLLLTTGILSILFSRWAYDDPFITYRYANNLSRGLGLVYNPGERLLSTTTPLFALLLAILSPILPDLHGLAIIIGAFSLAVGGLCLWDLATHPNLKFARWVGLFFYPYFPLVASTISSETPLYLMLCLGAIVSYRRKWYYLTALSAALAVLTRPDGVLITVILGLHFLWSSWAKRLPLHAWHTNLPWKAGLIYLGIGLGWILFARVYYGSPIPVTLFAKQQQAFIEGSIAFLPGVLIIMSWYSNWVYQVQALLALPGLVYGLNRLPAFRMLAAWSGLYFIGYSLLAVTRYHWYYAPLVPVFILSLGLGLDGLRILLTNLINHYRGQQESATTLSNNKQHILTLLPRVAYWLMEAILIILFVFQLNQLWKMHLRTDTRFPIYKAAGEWVKMNTPEEASVGALEIGIIGYYAQRPMVDFAGLIQPDIASQIGQLRTYSATAGWAIGQYHPDYLVMYQDMFSEISAQIPYQCQLLVTFPGKDYNFSHDMGIYTCP